MQDQVCVALGGRVAEMLKFGKLTTGASDDFYKVTKLAYSQVVRFGMSSSLANISYPMHDENDVFINKPYSEETARKIDQEVWALIDAAYKKTETVLRENIHYLDSIGNLLFEKEVISHEEIEAIMGPRPHKTSTISDEFFKDSEKKSESSSSINV